MISPNLTQEEVLLSDIGKRILPGDLRECVFPDKQLYIVVSTIKNDVYILYLCEPKPVKVPEWSILLDRLVLRHE